MRKTLLFLVLYLMGLSCWSQSKPYGPIPSEKQLHWQEMEMYAFIHYSMNTYTDQEWGFGNEDLKLFNPSDLDCRQWARVCKQAGMSHRGTEIIQTTVNQNTLPIFAISCANCSPNMATSLRCGSMVPTVVTDGMAVPTRYVVLMDAPTTNGPKHSR